MNELQTAWAAMILDAFAGAGVADVVISPGSRSTPFVAAAARHPRLRTHLLVDERVAAFFALGLAKASGRVPLLVCTSGSAPAHYHPAVIEAAASGTPLVILSADRPIELHDCGALQTTDQQHLYGRDARGFFELGVADESPAALRATRRAVVQAVATARGPVPGAVQVNARARKPLEPAGDDHPAVAAVRAEPLPVAFEPRLVPDPRAVDALARLCVDARRGLIVAGPQTSPAHRVHVTALVRATGFPFLAEAGSQLRSVEESFAVDPLARVLPGPAELVVQLGAVPTPAAWDAYLERCPPRTRVVVAENGWPDPSGRADLVVRASVSETARAVAARIAELGGRAPSPWREEVSAAERRARAAVAAVLAGGWSEGLVAARVAAAAPPLSLLLVGNSLPIRALEIYARPEHLTVLTQRGASGIDGLVAGAAGAAATGIPRPASRRRCSSAT
jgi:2-succinyl-5-enolpyruvyl-6-hydroxy-3-cyclohexene-1-carboxylate synthase